MDIIKIEEHHYRQLAEIYLEGIATGNATFETGAPSWEDWNKSHLTHSRIAVFDNDEMAGWASLSPVNNRCVYGGVGEVSVYVSNKHRNKGIGKILLLELIKQSEENGLWTLQSGIFSENITSIKLHENCGFRKIGYREKIGKMNGIWRDNIIMERRSKTVGV